MKKKIKPSEIAHKFNAWNYWKLPLPALDEMCAEKSSEQDLYAKVATEKKSMTAIHWAINQYCYTMNKRKKRLNDEADRVLNYLIDVGADPNVKNGRREESLRMFFGIVSSISTHA